MSKVTMVAAVIGLLAVTGWISFIVVKTQRDILQALVDTFVNQRKVNGVLSRLARDFGRACEHQNSCRAAGRIGYFVLGEEQLEQIEREVAAAKRAFWDAHVAARACGFEVHNSYKDYLAPQQPATA